MAASFATMFEGTFAMAQRFVVLLLLAALAAPPPATFMAPADASEPAAIERATVAERRGGKKRPRFRTVTRTEREPLTQTFTNPALIDNPNGDVADEDKPADLYPSAIVVTGFRNGTIRDVDVILHGFTHDVANDADILVTASQLPGRRAVVMSDSCGELVTNLTLGLDDEAVAPLPQDLCPSGTFQPTNRGAGADTFPAPGPGDIPPGSSALSVFDGGDPNGIWQLFLVDDIGDLDPGQIERGWSLRITAEVDVQIQDRVKIRKGKKGKGRR
jgi:hypothetical protein